ncbi:MAG: hypothetical protein ACRDYZ_03920 [Acidimicrobiales bacterium]
MNGRLETILDAAFEGRAMWISVRDTLSVPVGDGAVMARAARGANVRRATGHSRWRVPKSGPGCDGTPAVGGPVAL